MAAYRALTFLGQQELANLRSVAAIKIMGPFRNPINKAKRTAEDASVTAGDMELLSMGQSMFMKILQCRVLMKLNTISLDRTTRYWCAVLTSVQPY